MSSPVETSEFSSITELQLPPEYFEPSFVETLSAWSTLAAAVATLLSVIFITWQIVLTRKSVEATEAALALARDEFAHGQMLRVDAQRAAIDAEMPRLTVEVHWQADQAQRLDRTTVEPYSGERHPADVEPGREFELPRHADVPLRVACSVVISNDGPRRARVTIHRDEPTVEVVIPSGKSHSVRLYRNETFAEWVAIARGQDAGRRNEPVVIGMVTYEFPGDVGATEVHEVTQRGTLVERVAGSDNAWRIVPLAKEEGNGESPLATVVRPFSRIYWASRSANRRLDTVAAGSHLNQKGPAVNDRAS